MRDREGEQGRTAAVDGVVGGGGLVTIDEETGVVVRAAALDYEGAQSLTLVVEAYDGGAEDGFATLTSAASVEVTVTVEDANDNPPVITGEPYEESVDENILGAVVVATEIGRAHV